MEERENIFTPVLIQYLLRQSPVRVFLEHPLEQVINIIKVIIEGLAVNTALLNKVFYGYLINRLDGKHLFKRITK